MDSTDSSEQPGIARVAVITEASRGLGAAIARRLAADPGTHVVVGYRRREHDADAVVEAIADAGGQAEALALDVCDAAAVVAAVDGLVARLEHAGSTPWQGVELWRAWVTARRRSQPRSRRMLVPMLHARE